MVRASVKRPNINEVVPPHPKWHNCAKYPGGPKCGEILVSFDIVSPDHMFKEKIEKINLSNYINKSWVKFEIQVLGLRNLQSAGILPVKKATITFNFKNMLPPDS